MKELNKSSMYYRGLGDLTYNEVLERKYKFLKSTIITLIEMTVIMVVILFIQGLVGGWSSEYSHGYNDGAIFCLWFFACFIVSATWFVQNERFELRLKEIEG